MGYIHVSCILHNMLYLGFSWTSFLVTTAMFRCKYIFENKAVTHNYILSLYHRYRNLL